jgi:hypothetical protein
MQRGVRNIGLSAIMLGLLVGPIAANAATVTYDFTVVGTTGPLTGVSSNGSFSFDSSIIPGGGGFVTVAGSFTSLAFSWNGISYSAATANTGQLGFNAAGNLTNFFFGDKCGAGICAITAGMNDWWLQDGSFVYSVLANPQQAPDTWAGTGTLAPVPLPAAGWLLLSGLGGLGLLGRKRGGAPALDLTGQH